jgi:hypothetical protein
MQNVLLFLKNERHIICIFFLKKEEKQDISVVHLIKKYSNFVNFLFSWSSVDTVGIRGDEDGGKFSPEAGIGDGENFGERGRKRGNSLRTFRVPLTPLVVRSWLEQEDKSELVDKIKQYSVAAPATT